MRCEDIRERLVELLYGEPDASAELKAHVEACSSCRKELDALKKVRTALGTWKDEAPLRPVLLPARAPKPRVFRIPAWARYSAAAAVLVLAFLAGLLSGDLFRSSELYTKAETRELIKQALYDTEARMSENMKVQLESVLDTVEHEQGDMYLRLTSVRANQNRNKN
jgi:predicted anti-sigma-YlaC factor YlaD